MKDIGIIDSQDGPTAIFLPQDDENFWKSGGIIEEDTSNNLDETVSDENEEVLDNDISENATITEEVIVDSNINNRTMAENLDAGVKIMGIGMVAVFGVLTILYIIVKIMGQFAKGKSNEKN